MTIALFITLFIAACAGLWLAAWRIHRNGVRIGEMRAEVRHRREMTVAVLQAKAEGARTERARAGRFDLGTQLQN